jgi:hypothetical protein
VARIVLDTDVVSHYRAGRLPAGHHRRLTANQHCIAFESGLLLLTLNRRDFANFAEHEGLVLLNG